MKNSLLFLFTIILSVSCTVDTSEIEDRIDSLEKVTIASIQSQITQINQTLGTMQSTQTQLSSYVSNLQTSVGVIWGNYGSLQNTIADLQQKNQAFEKDLQDLESLISDRSNDVKLWVESAYATLQEFNKLQRDVAGIYSNLQNILSRLDGLDETTSYLRDATSDLTNKFGKCQEDINEIRSDLEALQEDIGTVKQQIAAIISSVQSVVVVPDYSDGSVKMADDTNNLLRFEVYPLSTAENLALVGVSTLSLDYVETQTKAEMLVNIPLSDVYFDGEFLNVIADGTGLKHEIKEGAIGANARLRVSDGIVMRSTDFFRIQYDSSSVVISGLVQGTVVSSTGTPIEGVVVSDGLHCTKTNVKGEWKLDVDLENADYVYVSTPSGYSAPLIDGTPVFWKFLSEQQKTDDVYKDVTFTLDRISRPDHFSIIIYADPQSRSKSAGYDNIGYHSLDCCNDMYRDMKECVTNMTGRLVYGLGLGDIVHRSLNLLPQHKAGFADAGIRNYNVIGNHDHDTETVFPANTPERAAAKAFEAVLGPVNYSFNLGDLHIVVLDNMISPQGNDGKFSDSCKDGLTDDIWQWLQNDLQYVSKDKTLMVCAHSPMFRLIGGQERVALHSADYKNLLSKYKKVLHWAGHVHSSMNYVDENNPTIECHSVTRVTGDLWTNEYLGSNGTPRGYIVFDYDGGNFKWHFKPIYYQTGSFSGSYGGPATAPPYTFRDWDYLDGKAIIRGTSLNLPLDESYQMQVFAPGSYPGIDGTHYLYANIFLWDELWDLPRFTMNGESHSMARVTDKNYCYSLANWEIKEYYKTHNSHLAENEYGFSSSNTESIFRVYVEEEHGTGTVTVTDRFGKTYSTGVSW